MPNTCTDQSARIKILAFICFITFLLYWCVNTLFIVSQYENCWEVQDIWLNQDLRFNPIIAYTALILIMFTWTSSEITLFIYNKKFNNITDIVLLTTVNVFLLCAALST